MGPGVPGDILPNCMGCSSLHAHVPACPRLPEGQSPRAQCCLHSKHRHVHLFDYICGAHIRWHDQMEGQQRVQGCLWPPVLLLGSRLTCAKPGAIHAR